MASFDSILNAVIPYAIAIGGIGLFFYILREPLGALWRGIKSIFSMFSNRDEVDTAPVKGGYIQYE